MSFIVPAFPLVVDVYRGPWLTRAFALSVAGNLGVGRRVLVLSDFGNPKTDLYLNVNQLLLPALTDVRDRSQGGSYDVVEVPSGSGRWYGVFGVDDAGKGFPNEHRYAWVAKIWQGVDAVEFAGLFWPTPIP